jgi:ATP adenylyltransferase
MSDRIWAPWRMQYIRSPKPANAGCVLCGYVGQAPSRENGVLARRGGAYVVLNKYPYAAGHLMIVPAAHVRSLTELTAEAHDALFRLVRDSIECVEKASGADGMNVGINLGRAAGAGIAEHLHVHVVPRWVGDQNFMPVVGETHVLPEALEDAWSRLAEPFRSLDEASP